MVAVSLIASLNVIQSKFQVAFMAPTEILAKQHFNLAKKILNNDIKIQLLTGKTEYSERKIILKKQLSSLPRKIDPKKIIIAYEPVWAIGTGKVPSLNDINKIHEKIRSILSNLVSLSFSKHVSILYGLSLIHI